MKTNIGEAILILGCLYCFFNYELTSWAYFGIAFLTAFAVFTWEYTHHPKELKELTRANIENIKFKTELMKAQVKLYAVQAAEIAKRTHGS